ASPVRLQFNLVPLYLPATISPGPFQLPATDWKNALSGGAADAAGASVDVAASAAASPPISERVRRYMCFSQASANSFRACNLPPDWLTSSIFALAAGATPGHCRSFRLPPRGAR